MIATTSRYDKELARHVPRRIRSSLPFVMKRGLYIHAIRIRMNSVMRAADTYSWRNSFAGNHEEGSVSSHRATPRHVEPSRAEPRRRRAGPLLFFLALFVFGDNVTSRYALFIVVSTLDQHMSRHPYQYTAYVTYI